MRLWVNGELRTARDGLLLEALLGELGLTPVKIAVELNREIVPKSRYSDTVLGEGDRLEIVHFVGGG